VGSGLFRGIEILFWIPSQAEDDSICHSRENGNPVNIKTGSLCQAEDDSIMDFFVKRAMFNIDIFWQQKVPSQGDL
jgi:hypothetical protein